MIKEIWKDIVGYEGWYSVSNFGRIRREKKYYSTNPGRLVKQSFDNLGYLRVDLSKYGHRKTLRVHKIVSLVFLGKTPDGYQINHKDCNKKNNVINNLEFMTPKNNTLHAHKNGRCRWKK